MRRPWLLLVFVGLNAADLWLTWRLVQQSEGRVYESNPFAVHWLTEYGWAGLAFYKVMIAGAALCLLVALRSRAPRAAGRLLVFACACLAGVVGYSTCLAGFSGRPGWMPAEEVAEMEVLDSLEAQSQDSNVYREILTKTAADLAAGECTLIDASRRLSETSQGRSERWLDLLHKNFPQQSDPACLAANALQFAVTSSFPDLQRAERIADRLEAEFHSTFGRPAPEEHRLRLSQLQQDGGRLAAQTRPGL